VVLEHSRGTTPVSKIGGYTSRVALVHALAVLGAAASAVRVYGLHDVFHRLPEGRGGEEGK